MTPSEIQHFLLSLNPLTGKLKVEKFGTDYVAAQAAYASAEQADVETRLDTVLISSDSLETIERTHSSYFKATLGQLKKELLADTAR